MTRHKEAISQLSQYVLCKSAQHVQRDHFGAVCWVGTQEGAKNFVTLPGPCNLGNNLGEAFGELNPAV
jgi:hypothetical protein